MHCELDLARHMVSSYFIYIGITIHFVHPEIFHLTSLALACKHFRDAQWSINLQKINLRVSEILLQVINTATDNASNSTRAFSLSRPEVHEQEQLEAPVSQGNDGDDVGEFLPNVERDRGILVY